MIRVQQIFVQGLDRNFSYVLYDEKTKAGAVVDPGGEVGKVVRFVREQGLWIHYLINTHCHDDHVQHNKYILNKYQVPCCVHEAEPFDRERVLSKGAKLKKLKDGEKLPLGEGEILILHTPGHTPGSICLFADGQLLTGDTLFVGRPGKTIWQGGDPKALFVSLQKIRNLAEETVFYPGHDYGEKPYSTLKEEKERNPCFAANTFEEFLEAAKKLRIV